MPQPRSVNGGTVSAQAVSEALASQFGYKLDSPINYIQGVGVSGRIRLAEHTNQDVPDDIFQLVDPYVDNPSTSFGDVPGSASLAGAVWADDLFRVTKDPRYKNYLLDLTNRFDSSGSNPPSPADPKWRTEDMFMLGSTMGRSYALTQDEQYLDLLTNFLVEMGTQQISGLYWHDRETPFYWGRGNGFAVLGLAETLTYLSAISSLIRRYTFDVSEIVERVVKISGFIRLLPPRLSRYRVVIKNSRAPV